MQACTFIGHKNCPDEVKNLLLKTIENLIVEKNVSKFYVGTEGKFDTLVYTTLCELEKRHNIKICVVLAYLERKSVYQYYDNEKTIFPDELTKTPLKFAIRRRNSFMIDRSEYVVTYLNSALSNTYTNIEECIKKGKKIINLGLYDINTIEI